MLLQRLVRCKHALSGGPKGQCPYFGNALPLARRHHVCCCLVAPGEVGNPRHGRRGRLFQVEEGGNGVAAACSHPPVSDLARSSWVWVLERSLFHLSACQPHRPMRHLGGLHAWATLLWCGCATATCWLRVREHGSVGCADFPTTFRALVPSPEPSPSGRAEPTTCRDDMRLVVCAPILHYHPTYHFVCHYKCMCVCHPYSFRCTYHTTRCTEEKRP